MSFMGAKQLPELEALMPCPEDDGTRIKPSTAHLLARMLDRGELPPEVVASMGKYLDAIAAVEI